MKSGPSVPKLALILIALVGSGCGGYPATEAKNSGPSLPFACTSFAVYSDETFYGMNFDYPDVDLWFSIRPSGNMQVFQMEFAQEGGFAPTVGMNSAGLFASCQMLFPEASGTTSPGPDDLYPWQVYEKSLFEFDSVQEVTQFISDKRIVHWSVTLHDLLADLHGDAIVVEAGEEENVITRIEDDFIVMTNFPNADFAGQNYKVAGGVGADRYKIAYGEILDHMATFDVNTGLETLEKAVLSGEFSTQASMVFDPERGQVYIALKRDFSKIWRVSIPDGRIETFSGFGKARTMELGASGILASELESMGASHGVHWSGLVMGLIVAVATAGACCLVVRRRSRGGSGR
jgi:hypothetical protein